MEDSENYQFQNLSPSTTLAFFLLKERSTLKIFRPRFFYHNYESTHYYYR